MLAAMDPEFQEVDDMVEMKKLNGEWGSSHRRTERR